MSSALTLTGSPVSYSERLTASQVKEYLKIADPSPTDAAFDNEIDNMIQAAREVAELYQGRDIVQKQWDLTLDSFGSTEIKLREYLDSVDLITYRDSSGTTTTLTENTDYIVDLKRALVRPPYGESWPSFTAWPTSAVTIRFTSGGTVRRNLKILEMAMLQLIEVWFTGKAAMNEVPSYMEKMLRYGALEATG